LWDPIPVREPSAERVRNRLLEFMGVLIVGW
jgi:hypothetical protein